MHDVMGLADRWRTLRRKCGRGPLVTYQARAGRTTRVDRLTDQRMTEAKPTRHVRGSEQIARDEVIKRSERIRRSDSQLSPPQDRARKYRPRPPQLAQTHEPARAGDQAQLRWRSSPRAAPLDDPSARVQATSVPGWGRVPAAGDRTDCRRFPDTAGPGPPQSRRPPASLPDRDRAAPTRAGRRSSFARHHRSPQPAVWGNGPVRIVAASITAASGGRLSKWPMNSTDASSLHCRSSSVSSSGRRAARRSSSSRAAM